mgnify:CR=1 FL=1
MYVIHHKKIKTHPVQKSFFQKIAEQTRKNEKNFKIKTFFAEKWKIQDE